MPHRNVNFGVPELSGSVARFAAQRVALALDALEQLLDVGMPDRAVLGVCHQVLLADIGGVVAVSIFGQQMIERLVLVRAHLGRDRLLPLVGVVELGIDVDHHASERIEAVADNLADGEIGHAVCQEDDR